MFILIYLIILQELFHLQRSLPGTSATQFYIYAVKLTVNSSVIALSITEQM